MNFYNNLTQSAANYSNSFYAEAIVNKDPNNPLTMGVVASIINLGLGVSSYANKDFKNGKNNFILGLIFGALSEHAYNKSMYIACSISGTLTGLHLARSIKQLVIDRNLYKSIESASDGLMFLALSGIVIGDSYILSTAATLSCVALTLIKQKLFPFAALGLPGAAPAG